jgi:hypothetical protein
VARSLDELNTGPDTSLERAEENWLTRTAARAFAAAISALLIATLVVNRSNEALTTDGTVAGSALSSGTISLSDDDAGRALFDFSDMAPGRPTVRCIEVIYDGSITPVDLQLSADGLGPLAPFLDVTVESGQGAGFESCEGFEPGDSLYGGTLSEFAATDAIFLGRLLNTGDRRSFRITVSIQDKQEALGKAASADFIWEVTPS